MRSVEGRGGGDSFGGASGGDGVEGWGSVYESGDKSVAGL